jgi:ParB family chromosome partitioning protein
VNARRGGLGRGLGALIPGAPAQSRQTDGTEVDGPAADQLSAGQPAATSASPSTGASIDLTQRPAVSQPLAPVGARFAEIPVGSIRPNPKQPRQVFDDAALAELAFSLKEVGFLQPVVVRQVGAADFELVMGERRWRAAQLAGLTMVPAIVRETDDDVMLRDALLENLHREQLNPLEEGAAYAQLLEEFGVTHEQLAQRIGRSRSQVSNTMRLLNLPPAVQRRVAAGVLSAGHARALLALDSSEAQDRLAQRIVAEGLSVRAVEEIVSVGADGHERRRPNRGPSAQAPALDELAMALSDHFETRVRVELGRTKGKITIEFASVGDLDRIVQAMAPELPQTGREPATSQL